MAAVGLLVVIVVVIAVVIVAVIILLIVLVTVGVMDTTSMCEPLKISTEIGA